MISNARSEMTGISITSEIMDKVKIRSFKCYISYQLSPQLIPRTQDGKLCELKWFDPIVLDGNKMADYILILI
jgi:hypothetical protein